MTIEQVSAIGGVFYTSGGAEVNVNHPKASWFVPWNPKKAVYMLLRGNRWGERGF